MGGAREADGQNAPIPIVSLRLPALSFLNLRCGTPSQPISL